MSLKCRFLVFNLIFSFSLFSNISFGQTSYQYPNTSSGIIDDNTSEASPLVRTFSVTDNFIIGELKLGFNATHTYRGDIAISLTSPQGTEVLVKGKTSDSDDNIDVLFDCNTSIPFDDGDIDDTNAPYYDRSVKEPITTSSLSLFQNENATGTWTLKIWDTATQDEGTFNRAELQFLSLQSDPCGLGSTFGTTNMEDYWPADALTYSENNINGTPVDFTATVTQQTDSLNQIGGGFFNGTGGLNLRTNGFTSSVLFTFQFSRPISSLEFEMAHLNLTANNFGGDMLTFAAKDTFGNALVPIIDNQGSTSYTVDATNGIIDAIDDAPIGNATINFASSDLITEMTILWEECTLCTTPSFHGIVIGDMTFCYLPMPPVATSNESLSNPSGEVVQQIVTEDDGDGTDTDPDGTLDLSSIDLDPTMSGIQSSLMVTGEGTWNVDGSGNVTFAPVAGFTNDPTPIDYTISDNDGNVSNVAEIVVDYVPVATADVSTGNTTNTNVTVDVLGNDTTGDEVDATTVNLTTTGLPAGSTCTATDVSGDCIEVTVPGQGMWSVNETTGAVTFDPASGFTSNPTVITYEVEDEEGNTTSAGITIEYDAQAPVATANESLSNPSGEVVQQIVTEDDGDGTDTDPDGTLDLSSIDLDPTMSGIQSGLMVTGEGTWSVDGSGNVTFAPVAGFTNDPTPIDYTISDNDGNVSNVAEIVVDYVPVATADVSTGNTTNTNVILDVLGNDTTGDEVDATTVNLTTTGLPAGSTCTATDVSGDCIEVTVPGQGMWSVNETTGAVTFDPASGFTSNPTVLTYEVEDEEGNTTSAGITIEYDAQAPVATSNESLSNPSGDVVQQIVTEDDGDGTDADPDGTLDLSSIDLDPTMSGIQSSLMVTGEGTWSVDGSGNVTFAPVAGFTNDPTPIDYTISDNDGNVSNVAEIVVDYVPVATADVSTGNTTNTNVTVDVLGNDTTGDEVDATTVNLTTTGLPAGSTCTATEVSGDCIEVTVPGQGMWSVNETTGAVTFDPASGFTSNPTVITYEVEDEEGNTTSAGITIEYDAQAPVATANESLSNPSGDVVQQIVTEDDGDGTDTDPDGTLDLSSIDLDPTMSGIQSSLMVTGEGTWSVDGSGNVTFAPVAGFTNDPTPIDYTISDNDGNVSNVAEIIVDYVPVATADVSTGNTTNTNVTVDVLGNDTTGDEVDATTVNLTTTGLPAGSTCTATDVSGDCIEVTVPGQGMWSVNETTGAVTFDPASGFTSNPTVLTYEVEDEQGNTTSAGITIEYDAQAPVATSNESLSNPSGDVVQQIVTEDDGDGTDADPDGTLDLSSIDLDPTMSGIQSSLMVTGEGTWSVDGSGNVTFAPVAGFTNDPTPIDYTISDNDGNVSNVAEIVVDYVPVATADVSTGNTTNTNVTVDVLGNDTTGDEVDATTVNLTTTGLPAGSTCTATDVSGDCIEVTVPGQGMWSVNETTGAVTFDPASGFTSNPTVITYEVEDEEGNTTSAGITIEYEGCIQLNLRVYLEGAIVNNGGASGDKGPLMRDDLRSSPYSDVLGTNYIPMNEPYSALAAFTHVGSGGGEVATATAFDANGDNSIVDWVFIELRDKNDSTSISLTRSALLQKDGDVVDVDGVSPLVWCGLPDDTYFISVRHRNHLGVMTKDAELITPGGTEVDFTNGNVNLSGEFDFGLNHPVAGSDYDYSGLAQKTTQGARVMWLGNSAHNNKIKYESPGDDKSKILFDVLLYPSNTTFQGAYDFAFGYLDGDVNMDSKAKYEAPGDDQSILLFQLLLYPHNSTFQSAFDFMYEQLPN